MHFKGTIDKIDRRKCGLKPSESKLPPVKLAYVIFFFFSTSVKFKFWEFGRPQFFFHLKIALDGRGFLIGRGGEMVCRLSQVRAFHRSHGRV